MSIPSEPISSDIIPVGLGSRSYDIHVGRNVLSTSADLVRPFIENRKVIIVTDENIAPLHLQQTRQLMAPLASDCTEFIVPAGEASKSFDCYQRLMTDILAWGVDRQTVLVALGGGVIGDLVGFVAATLLRGVSFIQIPTSLLAQVDSSVGGKTGINAPQGKNLVGCFHQPVIVLADTALLDSLPPRELKAGYAEIVKYALLGDAQFFDWLEGHAANVLSCDEDALRYAVRRSCEMKAQIVAADETEAGQRALLNLGHTFAHAFEAEAGYDGRLLHGEAVSAGLVCAFGLSQALGLCSGQDRVRVEAHLKKLGLISSVHDLPAGHAQPHQLIGHMYKDKKAQNNELTFILVTEIGDAFVQKEVPEASVTEFLEML